MLAALDRPSTTLPQAFEAIVQIHNRDVRAFDELAAALPSFGDDLDPLVHGWIAGIRYNVYGFARWESRAERYPQFVAMVGDEAFIATVA